MPADEDTRATTPHVTYLGDGAGVEIGTYAVNPRCCSGAAAQQTVAWSTHRSPSRSRNTRAGWEYKDTSMVDQVNWPVRHAAALRTR